MTSGPAILSTRERGPYGTATLAGTAAMLLLGLIALCIPGGLRDVVVVALIMSWVVGWHVLSFPRARAARLNFAMLGPCLTIAGVFGLGFMQALAEGEFERTPPLWQSAVALVSLAALAAWPAAWIALAITPERRRGTDAT